VVPALCSILVSSVFFAALLYSTKGSNQAPSQSRPLLAFLGFVVSIAWISTLATEVVNLLKTLGVILSISDSLLGLTIFAVGNSLGDLVADITVARLGYPVMALSACFGGPMLNILLGVGIGGLYMTLHSKPSSPPSFSALISRDGTTSIEPYRIIVSQTLIISGASLLLTLVGLLLIVPLNGWKMDRKIGCGLVALWCVSTIGNVIAEVFT
jgi:sodium/potassium/calcium exchanger 6